MIRVIKFLLKEKGINWLIAVKAQDMWRSEGTFHTYDSIKMALHYKWSKEQIMYDLDRSLSMIKDFAQYQ